LSWRTHVALGANASEDSQFLHDSPRDHEPLEKESDKIKESIKEFNAKISRQFKKEQEDLGHDGAKPNPEDWSEHLQHNPDFREEFDNTINDAKVPEGEDDFTPDVFDDTSRMWS
jgi:transketolase